jgi:hypothetical protein
LADLQNRKYAVESLDLKDPVSGDSVEVMKVNGWKTDLPFQEYKKVVKREHFLQKTLEKLDKSVVNSEKARELERRFLEKARDAKEERDMKRLQSLQEKYDGLETVEQKRVFKSKLNSRWVSDDPLLILADAKTKGAVKRVRVNGDGQLYWERLSEVQSVEEKSQLAVAGVGAQEGVEQQQSSSDSPNVLSSLFKGLGLGGKK